MPNEQLKERPILFSAPMVRAILDGRKTQTRRIAKVRFETPASEQLEDYELRGYACIPTMRQHEEEFMIVPHCPYGDVGDTLWVRESFASGADGYVYKADHQGDPKGLGWKPSIHMPRAASRITLEITGIRCELLQEMENQHPQESDAIAEGINAIHHGDGAYYYSAFRDEPHPKNWCDPEDAFKELWQSINGPESWHANPFVWVIEFKRIKP